jgi:hypothetical protein
MNRRALLRAGAAAGAGGLATWAGLRAGSTPARAAAELAITGDEADLAADGSVAAVRLSVDVEWSHDLPEGAAPETVGVTVRAGRAATELTTVAEREASSLFPESDGVESVDVDLLDAGALEPSAVAPDPGAETTVAVRVVAAVVVENSDGDVLAFERCGPRPPQVVHPDVAPHILVGRLGQLLADGGDPPAQGAGAHINDGVAAAGRSHVVDRLDAGGELFRHRRLSDAGAFR